MAKLDTDDVIADATEEDRTGSCERVIRAGGESGQDRDCPEGERGGESGQDRDCPEGERGSSPERRLQS